MLLFYFILKALEKKVEVSVIFFWTKSKKLSINNFWLLSWVYLNFCLKIMQKKTLTCWFQDMSKVITIRLRKQLDQVIDQYVSKLAQMQDQQQV